MGAKMGPQMAEPWKLVQGGIEDTGRMGGGQVSSGAPRKVVVEGAGGPPTQRDGDVWKWPLWRVDFLWLWHTMPDWLSPAALNCPMSALRKECLAQSMAGVLPGGTESKKSDAGDVTIPARERWQWCFVESKQERQREKQEGAQKQGENRGLGCPVLCFQHDRLR